MKSDHRFLKYGLVHRDGNTHSGKYRIVACSVNLILSNLPALVHVGFQEDPHCLLQSFHPVMYRFFFNMAWLTVMAIILVFMSTWPRPMVTRYPTITHCSNFISLVTSDMSGWRVISDFLKYGLVHRDGNYHSSKYRIVACSVNLMLSNLPNLVHRWLPRRSLLFAPVLPSRRVTDFFNMAWFTVMAIIIVVSNALWLVL